MELLDGGDDLGQFRKLATVERLVVGLGLQQQLGLLELLDEFEGLRRLVLCGAGQQRLDRKVDMPGCGSAAPGSTGSNS